jgi:hypothetical protein
LASHSIHAALPGTDLYFPAAQTAQGPPAGPEVPASQIQELAEPDPGELAEFAGQCTHVFALVAPTSAEYVPALHNAQAPLPVATLYLPASQSEHGPPFGPVLPALQVHTVMAVPAVGASEFAGHFVHVALDAAPTAPENVPCPQSLHPALPTILLNFPATQLAQLPPSGPVDPALHLHVEAPEMDSEAAGQFAHVVDAAFAVNFPDAQESHNAVPGVALNEPAAHSAQGPSSGPVLPGGHGTGTRAGGGGGGGGGGGAGDGAEAANVVFVPVVVVEEEEPPFFPFFSSSGSSGRLDPPQGQLNPDGTEVPHVRALPLSAQSRVTLQAQSLQARAERSACASGKETRGGGKQ